MGYDDLKEFDGDEYTGMTVGGRHTWFYTNAVWREQKVAPDRWEFNLTSIKRRERSAPPGSGASVFSEYHWFLLAHQWARKVDSDSYATFMSGVKYKIAHKRPHWRQWSSEFPGSDTDRQRVLAILKATMENVHSSSVLDRGSAWLGY